MAKIQLAQNGKYEFWVDLGRDPVTGKRRQVHRSGFRTKKEAQEEIRRLQNEADAGVYVKRQKASVTFAEFAQTWHEHYAATSGNKPSTITLRSKLANVANKYIGSVKIKDLTPQSITALLIELSAAYKPNTLNNIQITISMILDYAVEYNLLAANPCKKAKKPKIAKTLDDIDDDISVKYLSKAELNNFMEVAKDYGDLQYYTLFRLLAYTGMRIGEVLALEVDKIDFNASMIKVRQTISSHTAKATEYALQTPKTTSSIRDIDVDAKTMSILQQWIAVQKQNKMRQRNIWHDTHDFVFTAKRYPGYPMPYATVKSMFILLLKEASLNKNHYTLHTLRHTHASLLAESGATLEQIQERLGHSNDDTTRRIYLHVTRDAKASMMANFANFMQQ